MKESTVTLLLLLFSLATLGKTPLSSSHIEGAVRINTKDFIYSANFVYHYQPPDTSEQKVSFFFNKKNHIQSVNAAGLRSFTIDSSGKLQVVTLLFEKPIPATGRRAIQFTYSGRIDSAEFKRYQFIELGLDWLWFPVHSSFNGVRFEYDIRLQIDDRQMKVYNNGVVKGKSGKWRLQSLSAGYDINIFISKSMHSYRAKQNKKIEVIGTSEKRNIKDSMAQYMQEVINYYNQTFGKNNKQIAVRCILRPIPDSIKSLGYFRAGYFVIPEPKRFLSVSRSIAHELSHYWWNKGSVQDEDWLNESFAEYSALMTIRELQGVQQFNIVLEDKKARLAEVAKQGGEVPLVYKAGKKLENRYTFLSTYYKGALLLHELESQIGREKFIMLLQRTTDTNISNTEDFLELLQEISTERQANHFFKTLKSF